MKRSATQVMALFLLTALSLALASCSSDKSSSAVKTSSGAIVEQGVPGGVFVRTHELTAKVTAVNAAKRTVTLVTSDGEKTTVNCPPQVVNFDQIRVGDQLKLTLTQELAVSMAPQAAPSNVAGAQVVALAPQGAKPGALLAQAVQVTATVTAIDLKNHQATLQFPDGASHTVAVREDVDLTQRKVGEKVVIRTTGVLALSVEKP